LLEVPQNYGAGREVLVNNGLLPATSGSSPLLAIAGGTATVGLMLKDREEVSEADPQIAGLSEDHRSTVLLTLALLRINLMRSQLISVCGERTATELLSVIKDASVNNYANGFKTVEEHLNTLSPGTPIDFALLDTVMGIGGLQAKTEEEFESSRSFLDMAVALVNRERVEFLDYFRFMVRKMAEPFSATRSAADEEIVVRMGDIYGRRGAQVRIAEEALHIEDWIGTEA
jgi:hypothetical protein